MLVEQNATKIDSKWLFSLAENALVDAIINLDPVISESFLQEFLLFLGTLTESTSESVTKSGKDYTGRKWLRGFFYRKSIEQISVLPYIDSIHPPFISICD